MKSIFLSLMAAGLCLASAAQACDVVPRGTCYVKETGQYIAGSEFFSALANRSNSTDSCVVGRVFGLESGRMYYNGRRLEKGEGCLSHREISEMKREYRLQGECETYTCQEL